MKNLFGSLTEKSPHPGYLRSFLWVLDFTISLVSYFIDRSRGRIVDEENGSRSVAPCLMQLYYGCH
ncbi:hypothetical protein M378DRAFT_524465 [Amanita muscaria Koide BX008]|uniref:Uncharacterized protein n=1 Tax=Amanita muscaria (strain Koide BX008) TaxID=946122 RepID=A0A0C2SQU0_AMAMK|nr:hypothetical protein M378DRAFT_524465 [Amanita muscaria Koide BX008]